MQAPQPYFQKQSTISQLCGLHALNNLFGQNIFTQKWLNSICNHLQATFNDGSFFNQYKHPIGGDFDANVLLTALKLKQCEGRWIDQRKWLNQQHFSKYYHFLNKEIQYFDRIQSQSAINHTQDLQNKRSKQDQSNYHHNSSTIIGYIINHQLPSNFFRKLLRTSSRHWIVLRKEREVYRLLDSLEKTANTIIQEKYLQEWIQEKLDTGCEVIEVIKQGKGQQGTMELKQEMKEGELRAAKVVLKEDDSTKVDQSLFESKQVTQMPSDEQKLFPDWLDTFEQLKRQNLSQNKLKQQKDLNKNTEHDKPNN